MSTMEKGSGRQTHQRIQSVGKVVMEAVRRALSTCHTSTTYLAEECSNAGVPRCSYGRPFWETQDSSYRPAKILVA